MGVRSSGVRKVVRDGKPHWVIDFRYKDKDGREHRYRRDATLQTATAARAEADRLRLLAVMTGSLATRPKAPRLVDFVEGPFADAYMATKCRPGTRHLYRALLRQGILEAFGSKPLDEITHLAVRTYGASMVARGVSFRPHLCLLRTIMRAAVELGFLDRAPDLPPLPRSSPKLPDAPTDEEVAAMLDAARGWLRLCIAISVYAGLRVAEVLALEVRDVDFDKGVLLVRRAFSAGEIVPPKSGHERVVPLAPELQEVLKEAVRSKLPQARVVTNFKGRTPTRGNVWVALRRMQRIHGLRHRSFHSLRHYFCSTLVRRGASIEAVRRLAGHGTLAMTQRYVHASGADLHAAIAKLTGK